MARPLLFFLVVKYVSAIGITECPTSFPVNSSTQTVTKAVLVLTAKVDRPSWTARIVLDRAVKNLNVPGYLVKSGDKKTFRIEPQKKNKKLTAGQILKLDVTIKYDKRQAFGIKPTI